MEHLAIISGSVREGRLSHRVALYLQKYIEEMQLATVEILDLKAYNFPLFHERLIYQTHPTATVLDFTERFNRADGVILVSPVYNADYSAALKNVIDLYGSEWERRPVAVVSASSGLVPGISTVQKLQGLMLKLGAWVAPELCTYINIGNDFDEDGNTLNKKMSSLWAKNMLDELMVLVRRK